MAATANHWKFPEYPEDAKGIELQFRLLYEGPTPSGSNSNTRSQEKHQIRRHFHPQLRKFWAQQNMLKRFLIPQTDGQTQAERFSQNHRIGDFAFLPLVASVWGIACSLDILFLRQDAPGNLIQTGGDIDNRIKVLFDALRVPENSGELKGRKPGPGESPFYCLMEDDKLITDVNIVTDQLLTQEGEASHAIHDVKLIIHVKTKVFNSQQALSDFWN